jgi:hypothetical protein
MQTFRFLLRQQLRVVMNQTGSPIEPSITLDAVITEHLLPYEHFPWACTIWSEVVN